jgi:ABC-type branched-subunit amino acid transport system substrate-binding protein
MRNLLLVALAIGLLAVALAAVRYGGGDDDDGAGEVSLDLRVGNLVPFSGDLAPFGEPIDEAARIAAALANEATEEAGVDASVTVVASEDTQTASAAAVEAATKLVQADDVDVIMGALASTNTIPVAESVTVPNGVLQISPASTSPAISDLADDDLVWRTPPSDALQGQVLAEAVADELGADATINVGARNDAYGTALAQVFEAAWAETGGTIGRSVRWNPEAATFDSQARQLVQGTPDGWVLIDFPQTWQKMGPALVRTGGWDPERTFVTDGLRDAGLAESVGRQATIGMKGTAPSSAGAPAAEAFDRVFRERAKAGVERQTFDAHAFDAVLVAFLAAVQANSSEPADIKAELQAVSGPPGEKVTFEQLADALEMVADGQEIDYEGASGPIDFDENGDPGGSIYELWRFNEQGEIETSRTFSFGAAGEQE